MTIINISGGSKDFPFLAIESAVLDLFEEVSCCLEANTKKSTFRTILRTLECVLQLTKQNLNIEDIGTKKFTDICTTYVGAISSESLFITSFTRKYYLGSAFWTMVQNLIKDDEIAYLPEIKFTYSNISDDVRSCINKFETLSLDDEMLWLWNGWPCNNKVGVVCWLPLYPIYKRLGKSFTEKLHKVCDDYVGARAVTRINCLKSLAKYIEQYPHTLSEDDFTQPIFIGKFWRSFLNFYLINEYAGGNGPKITSLCTFWRSEFVPFITSHLIPSGLFAEPYGEIPAPPAKSTTVKYTNTRSTPEGELVSEKLLTPIPLQVTDEEAMHLLFNQIQADVDIATDWATWEVEDIWKRYQTRLSLSTKGQYLTIGTNYVNNGNRCLTDRNNPDHLQNAAATIHHYGHIGNTYEAQLLLPQPLEQTAYELGLPCTGALLPHCILLVVNHPSITPSFLERLELFDKNGKLTGFVETDGYYKLIGHKRRCGSRLAQQIVTLNPTTKLIIDQMIAITSSIREYLKLQGNDSWRYLLLTCKQGFSNPIRIRRIVTDTSDRLRVKKFAISLEKTCSLNLEQRVEYAKRFSLVSLRASSAVLVYLNTRSIDEMSKALGHSAVDKKLIGRYLPSSISGFFQERWIRIFQAAIIVEALKESDHLLVASGLGSIQELDTFLSTHVLKLPPEDENPAQKKYTLSSDIAKEEIVFGINSNILTLLISLQQAVQNAQGKVNEKAKYWAEISYYLIEHIYSIESKRPDIKAFLDYAQAKANPASMKELIYA